MTKISTKKSEITRVRRCDPDNFYDILGLEAVKKMCSSRDIKEAYRKLRLLHFDKNPDNLAAEETFRRISFAYDALSDTTKKHAYDQNLFSEVSLVQIVLILGFKELCYKLLACHAI